VDNPSSASSNLDIAIEKVTTVTALHEPSHWVDDCYVLMGKAQYLKQDYESAEETFEYFEEQFDAKNPYGRLYTKKKSTRPSKKERKKEQKAREKERKESQKEREKSREKEQKEREEARKKKLKEREKAKKEGRRLPREDPKKEVPATTPKEKEEPVKKEEIKKDDDKEEDKNAGSGKFAHKPAYYEGLYWLSRTFIERERYSSAEQLIEKIEESGANDNIKDRLPATKAHLYIQKKEYNEALKALDVAIQTANDKDDKARYAFIAAQIYDKTGNARMASEQFDRATKVSDNYEMAINAKLNKIKSEKRNGSISASAALKKLDKIQRESKNADFQGEIHFAKAEINLEENDIEAARDEFRNALSYGGNSKSIQTEAYYKLASIYFDREDYVNAKNYYDSTATVIEKSDIRSLEVAGRVADLGDIVKKIKIIELQDSLLRLSNLSKEELRELALEMKKNQAALGATSGPSRTDNSNIIKSSRRMGAGRSSFFVYNPIAVNSGASEFKRIWGQRSLEDNWRRSNRNDASEQAGEEEQTNIEKEEIEISDGEIERMMMDVPKNPAGLKATRDKMAEAMLDLGILYRDRLQNYKKSNEVLEKLKRNHTDFEDMDQVLYYLFANYRDLKKQSKSREMAKLLAKNYPKSKFSKLANDPNYAKELMNDERKLDSYYEEVLTLFNNDKHQRVIDQIDNLSNEFETPNELSAKFALLKAMSTGSLKGKKTYINELEKVTRSYPNTPEEIRAKEILRFVKGDKAAFDNVLYDEAMSKFEKEPDDLHYAIVVVYKLNQKSTNTAKVNVSAFNKKFHKLANLKISNISLNRENKSQIVLIRSFDSESKAMAYYKSAKDNSDSFVKDVTYDLFVTTQKNFREIIKQRSVNEYRKFFDANYGIE